jgi:3-deoxy-D-manno-octulosonic-acid transferase
MIYLIYDLIFLIVGFFYLPYYFLKKRSIKEFLKRFILPKKNYLEKTIWIHAVSVGEVMTARPLVNELKKIYPQKKIVITTITSTGKKIAQSILPKEDTYYLPLDLSFLMRSFIKRINPSLLILLETELWPNLILCTKQKNIPIVLVNGRISIISFKGYRLVKFLLKPLLKRIDLFLVQTKLDKERFLNLGLDKEKIKITGNMKFDIKDYADLKFDYSEYRKKLGLTPQDKLLVAGSTHPPEEKMIIAVYVKLKKRFPFLNLLIAPRHPQRVIEIEKLAKEFGFNPVRISQISSILNPYYSLLILDTIGQLMNYYAIADIVFVGGSLVKIGGHNILEPALFKKPIIFGPYMFNFKDISEEFIKEDASLMVRSLDELYQRIEEILKDPKRGILLGERAYNLIQKNRGITEINLKWINSIFSGT